MVYNLTLSSSWFSHYKNILELSRVLNNHFFDVNSLLCWDQNVVKSLIRIVIIMAHNFSPLFEPFDSEIREVFKYFPVHWKRNNYFAQFLSDNLWDFLVSFGINIIAVDLSKTPNNTETHDHAENSVQFLNTHMVNLIQPLLNLIKI